MLKIYFAIGILFCINFTHAAAPNRDFPNIPSPPKSSTYWIAQYIEQNTIPMQIKSFESKLDIVDVIKFYEEWFKKRLDYSKKTFGDDVLISAKVGLYQLTANIKSVKVGTATMGTLTAAAFYEAEKNIEERAALIGKGFPAPIGSETLSDSVTYDPGTRNRTIVLTNQLSIEANALHIREQMIKLKWTLNQDQTVKGGENSLLTFRKASSQMLVSITKNKASTKTWIISSQTEAD